MQPRHREADATGPALPVQPQVHILGWELHPEGHFDLPPSFEVQGVNCAEFHLPRLAHVRYSLVV